MTQLQQAIESSIAHLRGLAGLEEPLNRAAKTDYLRLQEMAAKGGGST